MSQVYSSLLAWRNERKRLCAQGLSLGFVPTMGALHEGHLSLVRQSRKENDKTLVSIFVNPTQFDNKNDLEKYPQQLENDLHLLQEVGADYVLTPQYEELYADQYRYRVSESDFSKVLCGASRPGHFDGVLTVVMKLLNLADADRAYFGEKDFQQLQLIRDMVKAFFMNVEIVPCSTVRDNDGLAMSSRNLRLTPQQREMAPRFYQLLKSPQSLPEIREELSRHGFKVDYLEERNHRRFGAVFLGDVRLIDNVPL